jgi:hypothetical protein
MHIEAIFAPTNRKPFSEQIYLLICLKNLLTQLILFIASKYCRLLRQWPKSVVKAELSVMATDRSVRRTGFVPMKQNLVKTNKNKFKNTLPQNFLVFLSSTSVEIAVAHSYSPYSPYFST